MIEKLIAFLNWIQKSEKLKNRVDFIFSMLFIFLTGLGAYKILKELLFRENYNYYGRGDSQWGSWTLRTDFSESTLIFSLLIFLLFSLVFVYIYGLCKRIIRREFLVVGLIVNSALPIFVGIILTALYAMERSLVEWYIFIFGGLYAFSPYILFLSGFSKLRNRICTVFFDFYKKYIVSFLIGISVFSIIFVLGNYREFRYMDFTEIVLGLSGVLIPYALITWVILTYAWTTLENIDEVSYRKILKGGVALAFLFTVIWISPNWKETYIDNRIDKAQNFLIKHGETQEGYKKAASVWGIEWAMKERYLENRLYNKELYAKLFDQSIEEAIDEEIDVNKYRSRSSNGTSMLARGENAKVELNFAKHESTILSDIGAIETTVTYEFQNTDTQNQEVIYSIELPSAESAMTDLRLGLNLELTGALAPRGAAEKVYEDSLRRNIDPALLEQTGPTTYRLRVFPVLSKSDPKTQGRQRVQYKYVTPLHAGEMVTTIPKTDILNLKLTEKSEIMTRVSEGTKVLLQDSEKSDDIETLNSGKRAKLDTNMRKDVESFCSVNTYPDLDMTKFATGDKNLSKNIVFLDISKSAGEDQQIKKRYQELITAWKNNGVALDIYTFNTAVTSAGYDISGIDFWGTTDMARVITYIMENGIEGANIVILTDDSSYELALPENKSIDYKKLKSNRISLIQIGEKIRTLKTEVTKSILASEREVLSLTSGGSLEEGVKNLFAPKKIREKCESYSGSSLSVLGALQGNSDGKKVFGESYFGTGRVLMKYINPSYLSIGYYKTSHNNENVYAYMPTLQGEVVSVYATDRSGYEAIFVSETGYYVLSGSSFQKVSKEAIAIYKEIYEENRDSDLLEKIGKTSHLVNQSMSLIALETDQQRRDLERYSEQEDKYDTDYQNFSPSESAGNNWNSRREFIMEDRMMPTSSMNRGSSNAFFGAQKSMSLAAGSSSDSLRGGSGLSGLGGDGSKGGVLQYILVIILFPLVAWLVLRRKPKSVIAVKEDAEKNPE